MLKEQKDKLYIVSKWVVKSIFKHSVLNKHSFHRFHSQLSEDAKNLLLAMFEFEEEARISVSKILEHSWILNNYDSTLVFEVE